MASSRSGTFVDQSPNPEESSWRREGTELLIEAINCLVRRFEERSCVASSKKGLSKKRLGFWVARLAPSSHVFFKDARSYAERQILGSCGDSAQQAPRKPKAADRWSESFCEAVVR